MYRALPEMLHCLNMPGIAADVKGMEISVLERQRLAPKWQQDQLQVQPHQQQEDQSCFNEPSIQSMLSAQAQIFQGLTMGCGPTPIQPGPSLNDLLTPIKTDPGVDNRWIDFGMPNNGLPAESSEIQSISQVNNPGYGVNYAISRTASCPPLVAEAAKVTEGKGRQPITSDQKLSGATGRESFKKRKAEKSLPPKQGGPEGDSRSKKSKACVEEEESKTTSQKSNKKSNSSQSKHKESDGNKSDKKNGEASGCTSSEVQKPDYIHVRARRGQATDSHSLAERVRREKISERMKYLQDLVPGCNKITGKAGMLDEIINYVQSLQRQVEFLSMRLAAVNPTLDFSIDDLIAKQVLATCSTSMSTIGAPPDMTNTNYLHYNPIQQPDPVYEYEVAANSIDMGLRRTISAPVSVPETFIDPSCFNVIPSNFVKLKFTPSSFLFLTFISI